MELSERNRLILQERRSAAKISRRERVKTLREQAEQQRAEALKRDYPAIDLDQFPPVPRFVPGEIRPTTLRGQILTRSFGELSVVPISQVFETSDERERRLAAAKELALKRNEEYAESPMYYNLHPERDAV